MYLAEMADMFVEVIMRSFGVSISVEGFSDKLEHLLVKVVEKLV